MAEENEHGTTESKAVDQQQACSPIASLAAALLDSGNVIVIGRHLEPKKPKCPHCGSGLLWSEDRGAHCDGCDDFNPETDLENDQTLPTEGAEKNAMNTETTTSAPKVGSSALFVPLKREYFEAFEQGTKREEYRPYGPRWNERTCAIGRRVVLSLGYGKQRRLNGTITSFDRSGGITRTPAWQACYGGKGYTVAACIGITLDSGTNA